MSSASLPSGSRAVVAAAAAAAPQSCGQAGKGAERLELQADAYSLHPLAQAQAAVHAGYGSASHPAGAARELAANERGPSAEGRQRLSPHGALPDALEAAQLDSARLWASQVGWAAQAGRVDALWRVAGRSGEQFRFSSTCKQFEAAAKGRASPLYAAKGRTLNRPPQACAVVCGCALKLFRSRQTGSAPPTPLPCPPVIAACRARWHEGTGSASSILPQHYIAHSHIKAFINTIAKPMMVTIKSKKSMRPQLRAHSRSAHHVMHELAHHVLHQVAQFLLLAPYRQLQQPPHAHASTTTLKRVKARPRQQATKKPNTFAVGWEGGRLASSAVPATACAQRHVPSQPLQCRPAPHLPAGLQLAHPLQPGHQTVDHRRKHQRGGRAWHLGHLWR